MLCPVCQTLNDEKALECVDCGADLAQEVSDDEEIFIRHGGMGVAGVIGIVGVVVIAAWLVIQFVLVPLWFNNGKIVGEYTLDHREVEASIVMGFHHDTGMDTTVICPSTMRGTPGTVLSCSVEIGNTVKVAKVTITENGSFTWAVAN